jgi:hypothetical protein
MEKGIYAVRRSVTAFFLGLACGSTLVQPPAPVAAQTAIDLLVQQAAEQVEKRFTRALGNVAERRRERVFVVLNEAAPPPGAQVEAMRLPKAPPKGAPPAASPPKPQLIATLEVVGTQSGTTECREIERTGRAHTEAGDFVRLPLGSTRILVAPCVPLVDLAPEIPEVVGEKLRAALLARPNLQVADELEAERRAEAAYLAGTVAEFLSKQQQIDEVLYPVLLQTPNKLILNLEYFSVKRGRATDIDVVSAVLDDMMHAWLRAGRPRGAAPPAFRRLAPQTYPWRVLALAAAPGGGLAAIDRDSVRVLEFYDPGLRVRTTLPLGRRTTRRREPLCLGFPTRDLEAAGTSRLGPGLLVFSDERAPLVLAWSDANPSEAPLEVRPAPAEVDGVLEHLWTGIRGPQALKRESRWWPAAEQTPGVFLPCFADLDGDGRTDLAWTSADGALRVKLATGRPVWSFPGFGDVKAVQGAVGPGGRAVLWLTDPVWHGAPDRLHAAVLVGDDLQITWSSDPFDGTLVAMSSFDLNDDGTTDLVIAESLEDGTRLHAFLGLPGERSAPAALTPPANPTEGGKP